MTLLADDRGQTLHDFAIGMVIFLLVLGYVFAFVPGLFAPLSPDVDSTAIRVDRTADYLTADLLVEDLESRVLDESCTRYFFNGTSPTGCDRLDQPVDADYIGDLAALPAHTSVNVTMVRDDGTATYAVGPSPTDVDDRVIRAVRVVTYDGRDYRFVVRLW